MQFKDFVAVSGLPGLYKLSVSRNNGLIVEDVDTGKSKFLSIRKYQFTPLETVAIYTEDDAMELKDVFAKMKELEASMPLPETSASKADFFDYFAEVLPDYDRDRVMISDVKKVVKWYKFLKDHGITEYHSQEEE